MPEHRVPAIRERPPAYGTIAAPAAAASSHHRGDYDARHGDRESGYQSAQSECGSFGARGLDEDFPSEIAEEDAETRGPNKGGVDPTGRPPAGPSAFMAALPPTGRKEKELLRLPKDLPTVNDLHHWLAMIAAALVEASACGDRAEVAWLSKVHDPHMTFEAIAELG